MHCAANGRQAFFWPLPPGRFVRFHHATPDTVDLLQLICVCLFLFFAMADAEMTNLSLLLMG